jgi:PBP1b-binding outer membrane lipoprotein LpoB
MSRSIVAAAVLVAGMVTMTGCMTPSRVVTAGMTTEVVAGFSQDDIDSVVNTILLELGKIRARYAVPGKRRVVNVKDFTNDTLSRGVNADFLAKSIGEGVRDGLTNVNGNFIVFNERMAANAAAAGQPVVVTPEFVLFGEVKQRNMRKDDGDVYQEFVVTVRLVDVKTSLEIWQKRTPLRKEVDAANAMNG